MRIFCPLVPLSAAFLAAAALMAAGLALALPAAAGTQGRVRTPVSRPHMMTSVVPHHSDQPYDGQCPPRTLSPNPMSTPALPFLPNCSSHDATHPHPWWGPCFRSTFYSVRGKSVSVGVACRWTECRLHAPHHRRPFLRPSMSPPLAICTCSLSFKSHLSPFPCTSTPLATLQQHPRLLAYSLLMQRRRCRLRGKGRSALRLEYPWVPSAYWARVLESARPPKFAARVAAAADGESRTRRAWPRDTKPPAKQHRGSARRPYRLLG